MIVVHQPYFLPWLGFFSKLAFADKFVILDDVHFSKGSYLDRARYIGSDGEVKWLSLPTGQHFQVNINAIVLKDKSFLSKFFKTLECCYAKSEFYDSEWLDLRTVLADSINDNDSLIDINLSIIKQILCYLNIAVPEFVLSSRLPLDVDRTKRIISICESTHNASILVGGGSGFHEHDWTLIKQQGIQTYLQDYDQKHPAYKQPRRQRAGFVKGLSIIDCLLNAGKSKTRDYLTDSQFRPQLFEV